MGLHSLPAEPLTVARYLAVRAGSGTTIATLRMATSAIAKVHQWVGHESPCRDRGVREALKGWGRRLARPQRQAGALIADVLAVIWLTAVQPHLRGRGFETAEQAAARAKFDVALVAVLSDGGLRRSEAAALAWGDVQLSRASAIRPPTDIVVNDFMAVHPDARLCTVKRHRRGSRASCGTRGAGLLSIRARARTA